MELIRHSTEWSQLVSVTFWAVRPKKQPALGLEVRLALAAKVSVEPELCAECDELQRSAEEQSGGAPRPLVILKVSRPV
jgi:hypothetical protein